jgi:SAM-dependent methyltransferase
MNHTPTPLPHTIDVTRPSLARMHNYLLGGRDNYPADRAVCEQLLEKAPGTQILTINNRRFLERVIRCLVMEHGVRQFIDFGSGLPTQNNVHEIAQRLDADCHVAYIDNDPMVLAYGRVMLERKGQSAVVQADLRDPDAIMECPQVTDLIDVTQPLACLFLSVLHCIPDEDDPAGILRRVGARLRPGSFLVISQLVSEDPASRRSLTDVMLRATDGMWGRVRSPGDVDAFFTGLDVLAPGLGDVSRWRSAAGIGPRRPTIPEWLEYGGVGRTRRSPGIPSRSASSSG